MLEQPKETSGNESISPSPARSRFSLSDADARLPFAQRLHVEQPIIEEYMRSQGLDFFPTIFELVEPDRLNQIAAGGGFPTRYRHWRFGMEYDQLSKGYSYGHSKIYEMVINNDPCYAYLMTANHDVDQRLVLAHVYGHCDFFKNNAYFKNTDRKMMDHMGDHAGLFARISERHGFDEVEAFIDRCLSIENLIDVRLVPATIKAPQPKTLATTDLAEEEEELKVSRLDPKKDYMDPFINPPKVLARELEAAKERQRQQEKSFPEHPERDVMKFILDYAPLKEWQRAVLSVIRSEAYYFAPQAQTKIMNEGWASYWHSHAMTNFIASAAEIVDYADHNAGVMATPRGGFNPYKIGVELFRDIEDRWNRGAHGKEWEDCDDWVTQQHWDQKKGEGREKIFQVRALYNDINFIDEFLTADFCRRHNLFSFGYDKSREQYMVESLEFPEIKKRLLFMLQNRGQPTIEVADGNYQNRKELYLIHRHAGADLEAGYARDTLENVQALWGRPVHLETIMDGKRKRFSHSGSGISETSID